MDRLKDKVAIVTGHTLFADGGAWLGPNRERQPDDIAAWRRPAKSGRVPWEAGGEDA
jgi:hypothetical protein